MANDGILKSPFGSCTVPKIPVHTAWFDKFKEHGNKIALVDVATEQEITYQMLLDKSKQIGCGFSKIGVAKGDLVALFSYNSADWLFAFYGILYCGATVTTINPLYTKYELAHQLKDSGAKYLYTTTDLLPICREAKREVDTLKGIICKGCNDENVLEFSDMFCSDEDIMEFLENQTFDESNDVAIIPYSSGTTGLPKGVMLTHYNILANCSQFGHPEMNDPEELLQENSQSQTAYLCVVPLYHMYGMLLNLGVTISGDKLVILRKFQPDIFLSSIEKHKINILPIVPPLIIFLAKDNRVRDYDLSSVQKVTSGAAPLSGDMETELKQKMQLSDIRQAYGMTETTTAACAHSPRKPVKEGSCGMLLPGTEAKVVCPKTGRYLGANESGELWLRGPQIMKGYINNEEATKSVIDTDGFLHTGDLAYYDNENYFYIVDRMKELIKVKGFQVAPAELESVLLQLQDIDDAAVVGILDAKTGEAPKAFIVPRKGAVLCEKSIHDHINERVAPFKRLTGGIQFVEELPRLPSGKILRRNLKNTK